MPQQAVEAMARFLEKERHPWTVQFEEDFVLLPEQTKTAAAAMIGKSSKDISLTATTSAGLCLVAQHLPWQKGDEILLPLGEFPSNLWPWKALADRGVTLREIPLWQGHLAGKQALLSPPPRRGDPLEDNLADAIGPNTRAVALSWVRFQDGLRLNLEALSGLCRDRGIALIVDGIQGAGTLPFPDVSISAFATGGHKGLLGAQGMGFLWTDPAFRQTLTPAGSWLSVEDALDFSRPNTDHQRRYLADGRYLEQGVPNLVGCAGFEASLRLIAGSGLDRIATHVAGLQHRFLLEIGTSPRWEKEVLRLLELLDAQRLGSVLSFHVANWSDQGQSLVSQALQAGFYLSLREGYLRVAFHGYHDEADVSALAAFLAKM
jgi:selenocysteine lyase/cysteine desulfurase